MWRNFKVCKSKIYNKKAKITRIYIYYQFKEMPTKVININEVH